MKISAKSVFGILCVLAFAASPAWALTVNNIPVASQAMPWYSTAPATTPPFTGLNYPFFFSGLQDGTAPTSVDSSRGFAFFPGGTFTITYTGGTVSAFGGQLNTYADANGLLNAFFSYPTKNYGPLPPGPAPNYPFVMNSPGVGYYYPTLYTLLGADPTSTYYLGCLLGTFADATGSIVGQPFFIGDGPTTVTVPLGATRLQLGINDDLFEDNVGGFLVSVTGPDHAPPCPCVPLPATSLLFGSGLLGLGGLKQKFRG